MAFDAMEERMKQRHDIRSMESGIAVWSQFLEEQVKDDLGLFWNGRRLECETKELLKLRVWPFFTMPVAWHLDRKPAGSRTEMQSNQIVPDLPGVYVCRLTVGALNAASWERTLELCAHTIPQMYRTPERRVTCANDIRFETRCKLNDPEMTREEIISRLETPEQ